jgi:hypothetical protein
MMQAKSVFRVDVRDGVLGPHESLDLHLTATLDDTITHRDSLHLIVSEGDNVVVPLHAKGVGTTIFCAEDLHLVDMGPQLTSRIADRRLTLENRGRRKQRLRFVNQSIADAMVGTLLRYLVYIDICVTRPLFEVCTARLVRVWCHPIDS